MNCLINGKLIQEIAENKEPNEMEVSYTNCTITLDVCNSSVVQESISSKPISLAFEMAEILLAYNVYLYIIIALGVTGNFVVLLVFAMYRPSTTTEWFILFITTCDFCSSALNVPVYVTYTNGLWNSYGTNFICKFHMFFSQSIVLSSSFLICGLAFDRYVKVCKHRSHVLTTVRARNSCIIISIGTIILSSPSFVMFENRNFQCIPISMGAKLLTYYLMVFFIFCTATGVCIISYIKVTKTIRESAFNVLQHSNPEENALDNKDAGVTCCWIFKRSHKVSPSSFSVQGTRTNSKKLSKVLVRNSPRTIDSAQCSNQQDIAVSTEHTMVTSINNSGNRNNDAIPFSLSHPSNVQHESNAVVNMRRIVDTRVNRASIRTTKIAFFICIVFILSWIPPWVIFFIATEPSVRLMPEVMKFALFAKQTYLLNTVINPILYTGLNSKFRMKLRHVFCCKK